jgi:hypothetical protein
MIGIRPISHKIAPGRISRKNLHVLGVVTDSLNPDACSNVQSVRQDQRAVRLTELRCRGHLELAGILSAIDTGGVRSDILLM